MRILHVISTLNIGSGIANAVVNYYDAVNREQIQFDFLVFAEPPESFTQKVREMGARVFEIPRPSLRTTRAYQKRLNEFFKAHAGEWQWLHIHEVLVHKYLVKSARKVGNIKIALHSHSSAFVVPDHNLSKFKNAIKTFIKRCRNFYLLHGLKKHADLLLACSLDAGVALYGKKGVRDARFSLLNNALDVKKYRFDEEIRARYRHELGVEDEKVVVHVGRLSGEKNQVFLLQVFKKLLEKDESYRLALIGDGALAEKIRQIVKEEGLDEKVFMLGNRADASAFYLAGDIFVFPSIIEGLGISLIEAQASGLPCVASTGVPKATALTPYVRYIPLSAGESAWADAVRITELKRTDGYEYVKKSDYNVAQSVNILTKAYQSK